MFLILKLLYWWEGIYHAKVIAIKGLKKKKYATKNDKTISNELEVPHNCSNN